MGLRTGDPMPSEAELCDELGVSRGTLREALKQLEALGIVETRHGTGMFIAPFSLEPLVNGLVFHGKIAQPAEAREQLRQLGEVRALLEYQLIRRVAVETDAGGLARIQEAMRVMAEGPPDVAQFDEADLVFHEALYRDLGNSLVSDLVNAFWHVLRLLRPRLDEEPISRESAIAKHEAIVEAVAAGDPDAAERAMRVHFEGTLEWLASAREDEPTTL